MPDEKKPKIYYDAKGFPVYDAKDFPDREKFEAAALNDMETRKPKSTAADSDKTEFYKNVGKYVPGLLPAVGATIGDVGGLPGSIAGAGVGSLIGRQILQRLSPENFGNAPNGPIEGAGTTGLDIAANAGMPAIVKNALTKGIGGSLSDLLISKLGGKSVLSKIGLNHLLDTLTNSAPPKPLGIGGQLGVDATRALGSAWSNLGQTSNQTQ